MKKIITIILICVSLVAVYTLSGCTTEEPQTEENTTEESETAEEEVAEEEAAEEETADASEPWEIALIMPDMVNPFWLSNIEGAEEAAAEVGAVVTNYAPMRPYNVDDQVRIMEDLVGKGIDGIVLHAADSDGLVRGIEYANEHDVPVSVINTRVNGGEQVCFIGYDMVAAMEDVTRTVLDYIGGAGNVVLINGTPGTSSGYDRMLGMEQACSEYPDVTVLAEENGDYQRSVTMAIMETLLVRYDEIDAVICANDDMALGALAAIEAAGRTDDEIVLSGYDANMDMLSLMASAGTVYLTVDQDPWSHAGNGVRTLVDYLEGREVPKTIDIDYRIITKDQAAQALLDLHGISLNE